MGDWLTPVQAHRKRCTEECMPGQRKAVAECSDTDCSSWPFRFGKNPSRRGIGGSPEHKKTTHSSTGFAERRSADDLAPTQTATATTEIPPLTDDQLIHAIEKRLKGESE